MIVGHGVDVIMESKQAGKPQPLYRYLVSQIIIVMVLLIAYLFIKLLFPALYRDIRPLYQNTFGLPTSVAQVTDDLNDSQKNGVNETEPSNKNSSTPASQNESSEIGATSDSVSSQAISSQEQLSQQTSSAAVQGTAAVSKISKNSFGNAVGPVKNGRITSYFNSRLHPIKAMTSFHYGIDIGADAGESVFSVLDGTVCVSRYDPTYGHYVVVEHSNGVKTLYAHCSKRLVAQGQSVKRGQVIAKVGSTGDSTGPHLHFELLVNGQRIDPLSVFTYLNNLYA